LVEHFAELVVFLDDGSEVFGVAESLVFGTDEVVEGLLVVLDLDGTGDGLEVLVAE
jgi:hypothetical protein